MSLKSKFYSMIIYYFGGKYFALKANFTSSIFCILNTHNTFIYNFSYSLIIHNQSVLKLYFPFNFYIIGHNVWRKQSFKQ